MKILIVGEYSGFARNLQIGFEKNGQKATVLSYGDGIKNLGFRDKSYCCFPFSNIKVGKYSIRKTWILNSLWQSVRFWFFNKKKYDVIILMNEEFIKNRWEFWMPYLSVKDIKGKKVYLLACGDSYIYRTYQFSPDFNKNAHGSILSKYQINKYQQAFVRVENYIKGVIPISYDYYHGYKYYNSSKFMLLPSMELPVNTDDYSFHNKIGDKLIVFHGYRGISKGSDTIVKAMEIIKKKYPNKVETIVGREIPFNEYIRLLRDMNVVIDQCKSYGQGMNAIISLAMGKIVMSGNEPENRAIFCGSDNPVINIREDENMIAEEIEKLIMMNKNDLLELSKKSRQFVCDHNACEKVAEKYLKFISLPPP